MNILEKYCQNKSIKFLLEEIAFKIFFIVQNI